MAQRYDQAKYYTQKYAKTLFSCKYCGNTKIVIASDRAVFGDNKVYWSACCSMHACDCTGFCTSVKDAVKRWNEKHGGLNNEKL